MGDDLSRDDPLLYRAIAATAAGAGPLACVPAFGRTVARGMAMEELLRQLLWGSFAGGGPVPRPDAHTREPGDRRCR